MAAVSEPRRRPGPQPRFAADELRRRVFDAARAEFVAHGAQGASVAEIARVAGVARQSVYEQFGDKRALFDAVAADLVERLRSTVAGASDGGLSSGLRAVFAFHRAHPGAHRMLAEAAARTGLPELLVDAARREWRAAGVDVGAAADLLVAMCLALAEAAATADLPEDERMADLVTEFAIGGVMRVASRAPTS